MQWSDEAIILGTRRHGETSLIVELMTPGHGRHLGLVKGGRARKTHAVLQPGNSVTATWRARLHEHLGNYTIEPAVSRAALLMESACSLFGFQVLASLLRLLPERDPHPRLYDALSSILDELQEPLHAAELVVRFELLILNELGFGLDLTACAATGTSEELAYVSPLTGRAVSRAAGTPYREKLLPLPAFLISEDSPPPALPALLDAFRLTGFFLDRHLFEPRALCASPARQSLIALLRAQSASAV